MGLLIMTNRKFKVGQLYLSEEEGLIEITKLVRVSRPVPHIAIHYKRLHHRYTIRIDRFTQGSMFASGLIFVGTDIELVKAIYGSTP